MNLHKPVEETARPPSRSARAGAAMAAVLALAACASVSGRQPVDEQSIKAGPTATGMVLAREFEGKSDKPKAVPPGKIAVASMDADEFPDTVWTQETAPGSGQWSLKITLGQAQSNPNPPATLSFDLGTQPIFAVVANFRGGGVSEVAVCCRRNSVSNTKPRAKFYAVSADRTRIEKFAEVELEAEPSDSPPLTHAVDLTDAGGVAQLVTASTGSSTAPPRVFIVGLQGGSVSLIDSRQVFAAGDAPTSIEPVDMDDDKDIDVVVRGSRPQGPTAPPKELAQSLVNRWSQTRQLEFVSSAVTAGP